MFRGAGWNVIKVLWGSGWDKLFAKDKSGLLLQRMEECVDGEYQDFKSKNGAYVREHFFGKYPELKALVADMSDDEIWKLSRGGHDPFKVFAAYAAAVKHKGQPTRDPRQDGEGLRHGRVGRRPDDRAPGEEDDAGRAASSSATASRSRCPTTSSPTLPFIKLPEDSPEMKYLQERRAALGGYLPQRRRKSASLEVPPLVDLRAAAQGLGRARDLHHDGVRADARHAGARQEHRQVRGADRARRVAHLRHGRHVPAARHLVVGGPALQAAGRRPADVLPRGQERPGAAGGHQRGGRDVVVDRRGDVVQHQQRADDPVLHLLLDVRPAARRRPRVARRRHARARLPARRHRRPHDAERRRPAARGRAQPHPRRRRSRTASPTTRPSPTRS